MQYQTATGHIVHVNNIGNNSLRVETTEHKRLFLTTPDAINQLLANGSIRPL